MRPLKVTVVALIVLLAVPLLADRKPGFGGVEPTGGGCIGCDYVEDLGETECENDERQDWMNCESGITRLCDGSVECAYIPSCGRRCSYA